MGNWGHFAPINGVIPPTTNIFALKMDGWNTFSFPLGFRLIFRCKIAVSFRQGVSPLTSGFGAHRKRFLKV